MRNGKSHSSKWKFDIIQIFGFLTFDITLSLFQAILILSYIKGMNEEGKGPANVEDSSISQ